MHYYLEDDALWRAYYPVLDRAVDGEPQRLRLLDGVDAIDLRFLDDVGALALDRNLRVDTRNWPESWIGDPGTGAVPLPPVALELRLTLTDIGTLRRLYVLPAFPGR